MEICKNCRGVGLVSSGADQYDLNHGDKSTCKACQGTGQVAVSNGNPVDNSASPKAQAPDRSADSGDASSVAPKIGDPCLTANDRPGKLDKDENGAWICVPA